MSLNQSKLTKLNESYSCIETDSETSQKIFNYLRVERPGAYFEPLVKAGFKSPYNYFAKIHDKKLIVMNGHVDLLKEFGFHKTKECADYTEDELTVFLNSITELPFKPYDFQIRAFKESIQNVKQINKLPTSSGKSLIIALLAEFFRQRGKKCLLLVPNINLLTQFKNDIKDYNLSELYENTHIIGAGNTDRNFDKSLTISTWQSMLNFKDHLNELDCVITDECHRFASEHTSDIVKSTINCKYKFGFTGTLPEDPTMKMELIGLFGLPKTYITSRELIDRGLATPIKINSIIFKYSEQDKRIFKEIEKYPEQLKFVKDHEARNNFIINLILKLKGHGNTLVLFQHTEHGKRLFIDTMYKLFAINVKNKDITGKLSFEFQEKYNVYFLNGEDDASTREKTRKILEEKNDAILIANYAILSTGVNIRNLHNMVLASPLKAYTTITQSIGRGMRLHETKSIFTVYDLIDDFGFRKPGGIFWKQYEHRKNTSYNSEEYPIYEREFSLFQ